MKRIRELDGIRALAVLMVILSHSLSFLPAWASWRFSPVLLFSNGLTGVRIFFVLSGFLITSILMAEFQKSGRISLKDFYLRRFFRIVPAFYAYLGFMSIIAALGLLNIAFPQIATSALSLWNVDYLLGLTRQFDRYPDGIWYLGHTWTLALEDQFYWMWPLALIGLLKTRRKWPLLAAIGIVPLLRGAAYLLVRDSRPFLTMLPFTGLDTILVGAAIALYRQELVARFGRILQQPLALGIAFLAEMVIIPNVTAKIDGLWRVSYGTTLEAGLIGLIFLGLIAQPTHLVSRFLKTAPMAFIGMISYSLYLWQQFFDHANSPAFFPFPLNIVAAIGAATISYYAIERPFLKLKPKHGSDAQPTLAKQEQVALNAC